jgi:G3E family GTPase
VRAAAGGGSEVVATGPTSSGPCIITVTVAFANSSALTATATITVVGMTSLAVAALDYNTIALPHPLMHSQLRAGDSLVLLKCDATNYEQVITYILLISKHAAQHIKALSMRDMSALSCHSFNRTEEIP